MNARRASVLAPLDALREAGLRRRVVCLLVLAVVLYGQTSLLVQLLGPAHRHESAASAVASAPAGAAVARVASLLKGVRDWRAGLQERWHVVAHGHGHGDETAGPHTHSHMDGSHHATESGSGEHGHVHAHDGFQRHHHAAGDASVITLDGPTDEAAAAAGAGSLTQPSAPASPWSLPFRVATTCRWLPAPRVRWADAISRLPERPPRGCGRVLSRLA